VITRGNDRQACFFLPDDCRVYLEYLKESAERYRCSVHAYVLMTNHVHLLVTPTKEYGISHMMQRLGQRYVTWVNRTYRRTGTLWEGRYKSSLVQTETYLLTCMRYIELNPVRAGMVDNPADYAWSSFRRNGHGVVNEVVSGHELYEALGADGERRCRTYRELFSAHMDKALLDEIRDALNQELVLGSERFRSQIEEMTGRQSSSRPRGRPSRKTDVGVY